jgi:hypothetical protein
MNVPERRAASSMNHFNHAAATGPESGSPEFARNRQESVAAGTPDLCGKPTSCARHVHVKALNPAISAAFSIIEILEKCNKIVAWRAKGKSG